MERSRASSEVVTVGEVADVLLGQWSVAFHTTLADSQRAFCSGADHGRLARAAEDGRGAAVAVRDRYLAPERISGHSLQQALNLANADASGLRLDRSQVQHLRRGGDAELPEGKGGAIQADGLSSAGLGLLPADRVTELINPRPADAVRARPRGQRAGTSSGPRPAGPRRRLGRAPRAVQTPRDVDETTRRTGCTRSFPETGGLGHLEMFVRDRTDARGPDPGHHLPGRWRARSGGPRAVACSPARVAGVHRADRHHRGVP